MVFSPVPTEMLSLLDDLSEVMDRIFVSLDDLGARFAALITSGPGPTDLRPLHSAIHDVLLRHSGIASGAGVVVAPSVRSDPRHRLLWWWTTPSGTPEALRVSLDPERADFFDYTQADWYLAPEASGHRHASGPYVDFVCTNEYTVTLTTPVHRGGEFVGVAGADILVGSLEAVALPLLGRVGPETVLCNGTGRVIAAHSTTAVVGDRLPAAGPGQGVDRASRAITPTAEWVVRRLRAGGDPDRAG